MRLPTSILTLAPGQPQWHTADLVGMFLSTEHLGTQRQSQSVTITHLPQMLAWYLTQRRDPIKSLYMN